MIIIIERNVFYRIGGCLKIFALAKKLSLLWHKIFVMEFWVQDSPSSMKPHSLKNPFFSVTYSSPMKLALKLTPITCNKYVKHENEELKQIAIFSFGPLMGGLLRLTIMIYCLKAELLILLDMVVFISLVEFLGFRVL